MLALLILGGCVTILGSLSRSALRNAQESRDMTQAELLAESILAKVRIGIIEMESDFDVPITNMSLKNNDEVVDTNVVGNGDLLEPLWFYTLEVLDIDDYGLVELAVTVRQNLPEENRPAVCRLVRWFALEPEEDETETSTD